MSKFESELNKFAKELGFQTQLNEGGILAPGTTSAPGSTPSVTGPGNTMSPTASADPFMTAINNHPAVVSAQKQAFDASHALALAHFTAVKDIMAQSNQQQI